MYLLKWSLHLHHSTPNPRSFDRYSASRSSALSVPIKSYKRFSIFFDIFDVGRVLSTLTLRSYHATARAHAP